jgi:hypothetical protein
VPPVEVTGFTRRPLFVEVPLGVFAGISGGDRPIREEKQSHKVSALQGGV